MPKNQKLNNKNDGENNFIKFNLDKPLRIFVGEIKGDVIKKVSEEKLDGFKDGDKVVVMHSEDWIWFTNQLLKISKR